MMKKIYILAFLNISMIFNAQFTLVKQFGIFAEPLLPYRFIDRKTQVWQNKVFYLGTATNAQPVPLVISDGTNAGTKVLFDMGNTRNGPILYKPASKWMYFTINNTVSKMYELWRTDGTSANTIKIDEGISVNFLGLGKNVADLNDQFYYLKKTVLSGNYGLYKTNGNAGENSLVLDTGAGNMYATNITVFNGKIFYGSNSLYSYDGQNLIKVISYTPTTGNTQINNVIGTSANKLFFVGPINTVNGIYSLDGANNIKLEVATGAYTVDPVVTGEKNSGGVYARISNGSNMPESIYYCSDGSAKLIFTKPVSNTIYNFETSDNVTYMEYNDANMGNFLKKYTSIGIPLSEVSFANNYPGTELYQTAFYQDSFWLRNYITASTKNEELWRSDGIQENTIMVKDFYTGTDNSSSPRNFFVLNNKLYLQANVNSYDGFYEFNGDYTFTNTSGNNNWSTASNWKSTVIPGIMDLPNIPSGATPIINGNAFARNLNLNFSLNMTSGSLNIGGNITLNAPLVLNNNNLNLKELGTVTGNSTNYVVTNGTGKVFADNVNAERGSINFPIGTAASYFPLSVNNTGTTDTFSARVSNGIANTPNGAVNATWEIAESTQGGSNASITLGWNASQQNSTFDLNTAKIGHYYNGTWNEVTSGMATGSGPYQISGSGINSFSPFSVMNFGALETSDLMQKFAAVYPNPFYDNVTIVSRENSIIQVYDITGKLSFATVLEKGKNILNKSELAKGLYIYQIKNANGEVISSGKIIKR